MHVLNLTPAPESPFQQQQLDALADLGVTFTTLSVPGEVTPGNPRSLRQYVRFLGTVLRHVVDDYDLVHANYGLTAPIALAQLRRPVVLSLWGTDLYGRYGWLSRRCARRCDAVVVMSEAMRRDLGVDCEVVPHGVDLDLFRPSSSSAARAELGWDDGTRHVLFPYPSDREVKDYPRAERVVERTGGRLGGSIELHTVSGVPHESMPTYLNAADVLLLTSKHEGSPNVVKEALACDLPVVTTDVGDVRDRLDGVSPSAVCVGDDELVDALCDVLRSRGRSNGRQAVEALSLERTAQAYLDVYRRVLGESTPSAVGAASEVAETAEVAR